MLQKASKIVREHTMNLIECYNNLKENTPELSVFTDTVKPKSLKKNMDKQDFTPLKVKPIQNLLKSFTEMRDEIISDPV